MKKEHNVVDENMIEKLILVLRDYKDVYISHVFRRFSFEETLKRAFKNTRWFEFVNHYYSLINFYDNFEKEKLILYYEDLIEDTYSYMKLILNFLEPNNNYSFTKENIDQWSNECKITYEKGQDIKTKDVKILHTIFSKEQNTLINNLFKFHNEYLFNKYLKRYKENDNKIYG